MTDFISINLTRLRKNTIKRYQPIGENQLAVYFSASRAKIDKEIFTFDDEDERDHFIETLDALL